ncbi:Hypothetical protein SMB2099_3424 [Serratia marcescens SMB2099]|nr:Hypothetical protein SMB2099_3424 [Serratia marcescens SMB2099]
MRVSGAYAHLTDAFFKIVDRSLFTFLLGTFGWAIAEER